MSKASPRAAKARARIATSSSSPSSGGTTADTIAAIATAVGAGGVGIVRASGPDAAAVLAQVVGVPVARLRDRVLSHGHARDRSGEVIDEVLFVLMRGPRSFTGEDVAELHGHGGAANLGRLLRAVLATGARLAEPGEFTRRAFENGRLDLTRAEAIADIVNAGSERALRLAQGQLRGALGERIAALRAEAVALRAEIEASIDFPEDDLELSGPGGLAERADDAARQCAGLAASYGLGGAVKRGIEVAIRGPVNAGKSSLINALLGEERALVADEPGTTRDVVEGRGVWHGVPVTVLDTAGEREAASEVERRGIELGRRRSAAADVEIVLEPAPVAADDRAAAAAPEIESAAGRRDGARTLRVLSKCDLVPSELRMTDRLATSAVTGEGLDALRRAVVDLATGGAADAGDELVVTSERQRQLLERAAVALSAASRGMMAGLAAEAVAVELREAGEHLAAILGEVVDDEMLDALFARFCIGK